MCTLCCHLVMTVIDAPVNLMVWISLWIGDDGRGQRSLHVGVALGERRSQSESKASSFIGSVLQCLCSIVIKSVIYCPISV